MVNSVKLVSIQRSPAFGLVGAVVPAVTLNPNPPDPVATVTGCQTVFPFL